MKNDAFMAFAVMALFTVSPARAVAPAEDRETVVGAFVAAFNEHSVEKMLAHVSDGVEWLSVNGREVTAETAGKEALAASMADYFESCPSCRSELVVIAPAGSRVVTLEKATWTSKSGPRSQQSLAVYEFEGGAIRRVYYFPSEEAGAFDGPESAGRPSGDGKR